MKETYFASSDSEEDEIEIKALPIDLIWRKRVIRSKIVRENWMIDNGLENVMEIIKRKKWEKLFRRRELVHIDAVKDFYVKLTMSHNRKKDVARSKNVVPRFGKRDTTSYMDLIYMDHLIARRLVNLPRVMMRHMSYVISVKDHELPYGDWMTMIFEEFGIPLVDKKGEEPKRYDYFEETFLTICILKRENGIWWIGSGENRRRDDELEAPAEDVHVEEEGQNDFDWKAVIDEAAVQGESGSGEKSYDAEDEIQEHAAVVEEVPAVVAQASVQ
ncbi:hypothetical protein Dimus_000823 [Dionaea muscipula]